MFHVKHVYTSRADFGERAFHVKRVIEVLWLFHMERFQWGGNRRAVQVFAPTDRSRWAFAPLPEAKHPIPIPNP